MEQPRLAATPLSEVLARGPVPVATLVRWGAQLARALAAAHATGTSHGDVRASVVTVRPDGSVHLGGFGLPRARRPTYPAPEWTPELWPSPAADVYALGALLHGAGAGAEPGLADLWAWTGDSEPTRRPSAAQLAARLDTFSDEAAPAARKRKRNHRKHRKPLVIAVAVVVVAAVLGGSWLVARPYLVGPEWASPIGEVRTADPCALVDAKQMQRFGSTRLYPDRNAITACMVYILPGTGNGAWLQATLSEATKDDHDLAKMQRRQLGRLALYEEPAQSNACFRLLMLPDRTRVYLRTQGGSSTGALDYCAVSDAAVQVAAAALDGPALPRRTVTGPPNSLVWLEACNLADESTLRAVPGINPAVRDRLNAGWGCEWGNDAALADAPFVQMFVTRDIPLAGEVRTIGGRSATVAPDGAASCIVRLAQRTFQGSFDQPTVELLYVSVYLPRSPTGSACTAATTVAEAAAAKLPPPG
ncbi:hypothetical protein [Pseudonocardia acaciae]|uniref:hypothetical protein n=1 Tax=Pseudonocardia acaciae TaxID=551276 RepID=UPI00055D67DD|nr:hypothetical protein [Pseudonocardia acaciae]